LGRALYTPEPTQDIHSENSNARSGGNTSERLFRAGFTMCEAVAADDDCYQTCNFRDRSCEKGLDGVEAGIERRPLCQCCHGYEEQWSEQSGGCNRRFPLSKVFDWMTEMESY
jgi:hypothetical protein